MVQDLNQASSTIGTQRRALADRYRELNGEHPMSEADIAYISGQFAVLDELCTARGQDSDDVRRLILDGQLPMPSYLLPNGAEMVYPDLFSLPDQAGGVDQLKEWFIGHWSDRAEGEEEWEGYLTGHLVCLRSVSPQTIKRKVQLVEGIRAALSAPEPESERWLNDLHGHVDDLDALEPAFAVYDRLRFDGPVTRDTLINDVRVAYPRAEG